MTATARLRRMRLGPRPAEFAASDISTVDNPQSMTQGCSPAIDRLSKDGTTMTKKRMVLEIGMGTDIRGADPTKAACRALRDALWHNSLSIAPALGQSL